MREPVKTVEKKKMRKRRCAAPEDLLGKINGLYIAMPQFTTHHFSG